MAKRVNFGVNAFEQLMKSNKISKSDDIDDPEINELINQEEKEPSQEDNSNEELRN